MENNQFTFTGLSWMSIDNVQELITQLKDLETYDISWNFSYSSCGTRLVIENYDDVLQSNSDDSHVTFLKKHETRLELKMKPEDDIIEDELLIFTIDEDMKIKVKHITYRG